MEVKLNLLYEDAVNLPISPKNKDIVEEFKKKEKIDEFNKEQMENIIREEIINGNKFLNDLTNKDHYDVTVKKDDSNNNNNESDSNKKYDCIIEIKCKELIKQEIESKINLCMEKEKTLSDKQKEFKNLVNKMTIDEKKLEKKLLSLIDMNTEDYEKIINDISLKILDYDNFTKEVTRIQDRLIKYRDSLIMGLCFKIYVKKINNVILYIAKKNIIFLNNEKLFKITYKLYQKIIKIIIDEIYDSILKKISDNEIYKNHKEEYEQKLNFYKEVCYLFPILKYFEKSQEKELYEIKEDYNLKFSENLYDLISRIDSQVPKRNGLNITLDYFKEHTNIDQTYAMTLRRILLVYQKYNVLLPDFKYGSFLYD